MLPFRFSLGPLAITPNEVFALLGALLGGLIIRKRLIALGASNAGVFDFVLACIGGGAVGARLYYFLPLWFRGKLALGALFTTWSEGSGFYGAYLGAIVAVAVVARLKKMEPLPCLDAVYGVMPFGYAVGKVGCFLAGCCYGLPTPHGFRFAPGSLCYETQKAHGVVPGSPVHPIPLYDMFFGFSLFGALLAFQKRSRPGEILAAATVGYSAYRFVIEFFRDDPDCHTFGSTALRDSQWTAIVLFVLAAAGWAWIRLKKPPETAPATPK